MIDILKLLHGGERHPLHSARAAGQIIAELPADDPGKLADLAQWLRSLAEAAGFDPRSRFQVAGLLDDAGRECERALLSRYLQDPRLRSASARLAWNAVHEYRSALAAAYQRCALEELPQAEVEASRREPLAVLAVRALRARVGQLRAAMLHYERLPSAAWAALYEVFARCEQAGLVSAPARAYPGEAQSSTALLEVMNALLVAISAPERLPPEEIDTAYRLARRFAAEGRLESAPFEGATHTIDLAHGGRPTPLAAGTAQRATTRYLGAQAAVSLLEQEIGREALAMLEHDERRAVEYTPGQKITVLRHFMHYWGPNPPHAERSHVKLDGGLGVTHGFHVVCQYVPHATKHGRSRAQAASAPLAALEEQDPTAQRTPPETWPEREAGLHTVHAQAGPGAGAWAEVGVLCAIRIHDRRDWWLATIRRLKPEPGGVLHAEFEVLARKPVSVWLRMLGADGRRNDAWQTTSAASMSGDYIEAIVLTDRRPRPTLMLPKGQFIPGQLLELLHGERSQSLKFTEFIEQGKDYDWCAFQVVALPGA